MSHFSALVLIPRGTAPKAVHSTVEALLARYDENLETPERDQECYCVGKKAERAGNEVASEQAGTIAALRDSFDAKFPLPSGKSPFDLSEDEDDARDKNWRAHISDHLAIAARAAAEHPLAGKPDPECSDCKGTGIDKTTRNPDAKWDWWTIGGRWMGLLDGYKPEEDPKNIERCDLCNGTGQRNDALGIEHRAKNPGYTCNGCDGKGSRPKWPTKWADHPGDVTTVEALLSAGPLLNSKCPFSVVETDGTWHEKGRMGWWAIVSDKKDPAEWVEGVNAILDRNRNAVAVICDLHI